MPEGYDNIIDIKIDKQGLCRQLIREMSDEELDTFLDKITFMAYMQGCNDGLLSAMTIFGMNNNEEKDDEE